MDEPRIPLVLALFGEVPASHRSLLHRLSDHGVRCVDHWESSAAGLAQATATLAERPATCPAALAVDMGAWLRSADPALQHAGPHPAAAYARRAGLRLLALVDETASPLSPAAALFVAEHCWASIGPNEDPATVAGLLRFARPCLPSVDSPASKRAVDPRATLQSSGNRDVDTDSRLDAPCPRLLAQSPVMGRLVRAARMAGASSEPVLILGETGTGKELVARLVHESSRVSRGPFVAINCAAMVPTLAGAELFGNERGAFTGASTRRPGRIECAEGGTLFLDEIGDLPADVQGYLLRFLQEGVYEPLGGGKTRRANVRVVAATHVGLDEAVRQGRFRLDLMHRLDVLRLQVPPLRERGDDVELLAARFAQEFAQAEHRPVSGLAPDAIRALRRHPWPGNVRELRNRVRQAVLFSGRRHWLSAEDLGLTEPDVVAPTLEQARCQAELAALRSALSRNGHNWSEAARELAVSRMTLYRLVDKHRPMLGDLGGLARTGT